MIIGWWIGAAVASVPGTGEAPSFVEVVALHLRLDGRGVDQHTLSGLYGALCDQGHELSCRWRAWDDWSTVKRSDLLRLVESDCAAGDHEACVAEAWMLGLSGHQFAEEALDAARAMGLLEEACANGTQRACTELGLILTEDRVVDPDRDRATSLHRGACRAGLSVACLRAGDRAAASALADPSLEEPAVACEAGVAAGCEAWLAAEGLSDEDRRRAAERWCHLGGDCVALIPLVDVEPFDALPDDRPSRAWVGADRLMLRYSGPTFALHRTVAWSEADRVELVVDGQDEALVWVRANDEEDDRLVLPVHDECTEAMAQARALEAAGIRPRVVNRRGRPTTSVCIDRLGPGRGPDHLGGSVTVLPRDPSQNGEATAFLNQLDSEWHGAMDCVEAAADQVVGPVRLDVVHKRSGAVKVKIGQTSRSDELDACLVGWAGALEPAEAPQLTLKVGLLLDLG